jgi:transposase InsO family protein
LAREYASTSYQTLLREQNIQASMSKKGDCYDNAMIESFWATLKNVNSREKLPKSATPKVARSGEFVLAQLSASRKFPRTSVR